MLYDAQMYKYIDIRRNLTQLSVFEEASKTFPTAMIESIEDTDKMQDIVDKFQKTTVSSRCKISIYNLASRNENDEFD